MNILITLLILIIIAGVLWYVLGLLPLPQPFKNIAMAILALIFVLYLLGLLFGYAPGPHLRIS